jgi:hypothetical protein
VRREKRVAGFRYLFHTASDAFGGVPERLRAPRPGEGLRASGHRLGARRRDATRRILLEADSSQGGAHAVAERVASARHARDRGSNGAQSTLVTLSRVSFASRSPPLVESRARGARRGVVHRGFLRVRIGRADRGHERRAERFEQLAKREVIILALAALVRRLRPVSRPRRTHRAARTPAGSREAMKGVFRKSESWQDRRCRKSSRDCRASRVVSCA